MARFNVGPQQSKPGVTPVTLVKLARFLVGECRFRTMAFPDMACGEPAWAMLLHLYIDHVEERTETISGVIVAAAVPVATASRCIDAMLFDGYLIRQRGTSGGDSDTIGLAPEMTATIETFLLEMRRRMLIALQ